MSIHSFSEEELYLLIDLALDTKDKEWFGQLAYTLAWKKWCKNVISYSL